MIITSVNNEKIVKLAKLKDKKYRDSEGMFLVEGVHLVLEAYRNNLLIEIILEQDEVTLIKAPITYVTNEITNKLSTLKTPSKIFGVCKKKEESDDLGDRILLLDNIQDPGNLGTILRSAAAFGVTSVVLNKDNVDLYNPKVIRSSQGIQFVLNVIERDLKETIKQIKALEIPVYGTRTQYGEDIDSLRDKDKIRYALVMGNEGSGVNDDILDLCDRYLYIEMLNNVESLNVAVAGSILLYEFIRRD